MQLTCSIRELEAAPIPVSAEHAETGETVDDTRTVCFVVQTLNRETKVLPYDIKSTKTDQGSFTAVTKRISQIAGASANGREVTVFRGIVYPRLGFH